MTRLAIEGGPKSVKTLGPYKSKMHTEELLHLMDLWEYPKDVKKQLTGIIKKNSEKIEGPHLFRYYNPRPSMVDAAEKAMGSYIGTKHCLAVNSCTSALIASLRALGVGMGDEVIVPAYTFFASAAVIGTCNAIPIIADVDDTFTIDPQDIEKKITKRTKAIIAVHMRGMPARMDKIMRIAKKHKIPVIEDVAQAAGGSFKGKMLGSIGTMGCFSFDHYKIIASGEGGFITTNDEWLYTRAQSWHDCAACWRPDRYSSEQTGGELFCGENYRMSELQGAVALAQIKRAPKILKGYRTSKKRILRHLCLPKGVSLRNEPDSEGDAGICLIILMPDSETTRWATTALAAEGVAAGGIYDSKIKDWHVYTYWEHIMKKKAVAADRLPWSGAKKGHAPKYSPKMCPNTLDYLSRAVMIELHPEHSAAECKAIAEGINKVMAGIGSAS